MGTRDTPSPFKGEGWDGGKYISITESPQIILEHIHPHPSPPPKKGREFEMIESLGCADERKRICRAIDVLRPSAHPMHDQLKLLKETLQGSEHSVASIEIFFSS